MRKNFEKIFQVIDIETVPNEKAIKSASWAYKKSKNDKLTDHDAGLNPIFGQIVALAVKDIQVCIVNRKISITQGSKVYSFYGLEGDIISNFFYTSPTEALYVAHNGLNFDFHYIAKRALALGIPLPQSLRLAGLRPWNIQHVDTMQWAQMGSNQYISLDELCYMYDIPTSKDEMDGSQVWDYYKQGRILEIATYCEKDVDRLAKVFSAMILTGAHNLW